MSPAPGSVRALRAGALTAVALGLCLSGMGCGAPATTHTVTIEGMRFQPQTLTVNAGDTIVWVNNDLVPHTASSRAGGFDSGEIGSGASWRQIVERPGSFAYVCTYHPMMTGLIVAR
jgi:plastocyanin